ncbi:MAG: DUF4351 domain-containing protein [Magnetococcales bacterium]|nr:DUF4351 domain-containing protein [Magnetococcales bacterium]
MKYDATLKDIFQTLPQRLLLLLTGQEASDLLPVEFSSVKRRQPDLVVRLRDESIFHLEFQSGRDPDMAWRMLEYFLLIRGLYPSARIVQQVLYVGAEPCAFATEIEETDLRFCYTVRDLREIDCQQMLASPCLEENLLAILCRLQDGRQTVRAILARVAVMEPKARMDALEKLTILAGLRRLGTTVKEEVKAMPITVNVMEDEFLRDIFVRVRSEGVQEGIQIGERQTHLKGEAAFLLRQLRQRFGTLPDWVPERIHAADATALETWGDRVLTASSLRDVFGG